MNKFSLFIALLVFITVTSCKKEPIEVRGCTNPLAENYDPAATEDSGNCRIVGCMDQGAINFNPNANEEGECLYKKDLYIGTWSGLAECDDPLLSSLFGMNELEFVIEEVPGERDKVRFALPETGPVELEPLDASINVANVLRAERVIDGLEIDITGTGTPQIIRVTIKVEMFRIPDTDRMEGILEMKIELMFGPVPIPLAEGECEITATKK
jgi:hypothetical protein